MCPLGRDFSSTLFLVKNQIILAQAQCSYFFSGIVLTLLLQQLSTVKKGITVRGWGDPIEPEDNVNNRSSNILFVGKKNRGSIRKWLV